MVIMQARYGDGWFAIANADERAQLFEMGGEGPWAGDYDAHLFASQLPVWAAYGRTPDEAKANLTTKLSTKS